MYPVAGHAVGNPGAQQMPVPVAAVTDSAEASAITLAQPPLPGGRLLGQLRLVLPPQAEYADDGFTDG